MKYLNYFTFSHFLFIFFFKERNKIKRTSQRNLLHVLEYKIKIVHRINYKKKQIEILLKLVIWRKRFLLEQSRPNLGNRKTLSQTRLSQSSSLQFIFYSYFKKFEKKIKMKIWPVYMKWMFCDEWTNNITIQGHKINTNKL